jgi:hypothetical protein
VKCTPYLHDSRDACTARHGTLSPRHIHAAANEAWLRAGTETADRGVGKVTPPSALPNVGWGVRRSCGLPKMFRARVSLQRRLADRGFAGRAGPRHGGQPVGGQLGSTVGTAGGTPIGPINVQGESRSQIRRWVASAMNGRPNTVKGDGGLPFVMSSACYIDALHS